MNQRHAGIREITITDFRGIAMLHLSFVGPQDYPTQVVVIGGPNGSGKTSVLEACLLAAGHRAFYPRKAGTQDIRSGASDYRLEIKIQIQKQTYSQACGSRDFPGDFVPCTYFSSWRAPGLVGAVGITAGKRGRRPDKESDRFGRIKQYLVNARAHELFPPTSGTKSERFDAAMHDLNHVWEMFYPGQAFTVEPVSDDPDAGFDVFLNILEGPKLSVERLSSGQVELFTFAGGLITETQPQGLIVIDEPELHLDPQWHRQLLRALQYLKPDSQIIVATHSPEIYDSVRSFERHFLVPSDDPRAHAWNLNQAEQGEID